MGAPQPSPHGRRGVSCHAAIIHPILTSSTPNILLATLVRLSSRLRPSNVQFQYDQRCFGLRRDRPPTSALTLSV